MTLPLSILASGGKKVLHLNGERRKSLTSAKNVIAATTGSSFMANSQPDSHDRSNILHDSDLGSMGQPLAVKELIDLLASLL